MLLKHHKINNQRLKLVSAKLLTIYIVGGGKVPGEIYVIGCCPRQSRAISCNISWLDMRAGKVNQINLAP